MAMTIFLSFGIVTFIICAFMSPYDKACPELVEEIRVT